MYGFFTFSYNIYVCVNLPHEQYFADIRYYAMIFFLKAHFICNLYIYIQEIHVKIGCYGLGRGTH
jgi:hypothetical protein